MNATSSYATTRPYAPPPADLEMLRGPQHGTVRLPKRLDWGPGRSYQLDVPRQRRAMYEVVLQEAATTEDLKEYLDGQLLCADWKMLRLPPRVRTAWEQRLPVLSGSR